MKIAMAIKSMCLSPVLAIQSAKQNKTKPKLIVFVLVQTFTILLAIQCARNQNGRSENISRSI